MRDVIQHIDDVEIPIIEITDGWAADSVKTREECNDAFAYLMAACAGIEFQIDTELAKPKPNWDLNWLARARCALKFKKAALQIVQVRRSMIAEEIKEARKRERDTKLLEYIRSMVPDRQFLDWLRGSGVGSIEADLEIEEAA